ncbi:zincin-like metallopeptidase domain-containing protein, partial [Klebsiella pneumoniae]
CTLFHEFAHSTGHAKRLNRSGITELAAFGDENYSKEELIAEIGAAMMCAVCGIDNTTIENSAAYINGWLRALKEDQRLIVQAAGKAQRAADYMQGITFEGSEA